VIIGTAVVIERGTHNLSGTVADRTTRRNTVMATRRVTASIHQATAIPVTGVGVGIVTTAADTVAERTAVVAEINTGILLCTSTSARFTSDSVTSVTTAYDVC